MGVIISTHFEVRCLKSCLNVNEASIPCILNILVPQNQTKKYIAPLYILSPFGSPRLQFFEFLPISRDIWIILVLDCRSNDQLLLMSLYMYICLLSRCVEPHILPCFGDSKPQCREAAVAALTAWKDKCGIIPMTENDMLTEALKVCVNLISAFRPSLLIYPYFRRVGDNLSLDISYLKSWLEC